MPPCGITEVRDFLSPPFFVSFFFFFFVFFSFFSPRSLTGLLFSHASPRHNRSPRLPFSYILPFPFFIFSHHGPRPGSSIPMPSRGITGVHDSLFPNHCVTRIYFDRSFDAQRKQSHVDLNDKDDNYDCALNE